jgi:hypothetical protein
MKILVNSKIYTENKIKQKEKVIKEVIIRNGLVLIRKKSKKLLGVLSLWDILTFLPSKITGELTKY